MPVQGKPSPICKTALGMAGIKPGAGRFHTERPAPGISPFLMCLLYFSAFKVTWPTEGKEEYAVVPLYISGKHFHCLEKKKFGEIRRYSLDAGEVIVYDYRVTFCNFFWSSQFT